MITYAKIKTNAEPIAAMPYQWRQGLPKRGWKILSEEPEPVGRRQICVDSESGRMVFERAARHGQGPQAATGEQGAVNLTEAQQLEALDIVNRLWSENPVFKDAHRTNQRDQVTVILVDGASFKAFTSSDSPDELHQLNEKLWQWTR